MKKSVFAIITVLVFIGVGILSIAPSPRAEWPRFNMFFLKSRPGTGSPVDASQILPGVNVQH